MPQDANFNEGVIYAERAFLSKKNHLNIDKEVIIKNIDLDGKDILDFGCGMGGMSTWYAQNWNCNVLGIDIDQFHIDVAQHIKRKYDVQNVSFECQDILTYPNERKFDLIVMNDVAEHIEINTLELIMASLKERLKRGGKILITYPPWHGPYASHLHHDIKILWSQFIPKPILHRLIVKNNRQLVGKEDLMTMYYSLNHLTHDKLMRIMRKIRMKKIFRKSHSIISRLWNINARIFPFYFLITKELVIFTRDSVDTSK
ncbi:MAG: class I SAM-dependent methyltransferase [Cyclobacteriaceae bacterium]